eukprot:CAMPEP_0195089722 /NCGR_PEP_ID=MMETSP0448-20130528/28932_1 /TAXON_ID=66468 /ORGANISM="Heterocapsa triquestra, Strain CCMP 448" /LENGTH=56 /DNA_ID=CAMNT_0040123473 /DNA_START=62 /DNA_END=229 /DNA_ORIENTATION=-
MPVRQYIIEDGVAESSAQQRATAATSPADKAVALRVLAKTQLTCGKLAEALTTVTE